ncbi:MAG TPA: hypothetical protein PK340_01105 [Bacilli bacterium]|nr:hypothetical protein [Bacilli bacterium]
MAQANVFIVRQEYQADYKVFFVDQAYQEKNAEIIKGGKLVNQEYQANVKVFIVDQEYKANIKILRQNFPK